MILGRLDHLDIDNFTAIDYCVDIFYVWGKVFERHGGMVVGVQSL